MLLMTAPRRRFAAALGFACALATAPAFAFAQTAAAPEAPATAPDSTAPANATNTPAGSTNDEAPKEQPPPSPPPSAQPGEQQPSAPSAPVTTAPPVPAPASAVPAAQAASATGPEDVASESGPESVAEEQLPPWSANLIWSQAYVAAGFAPSAYPTFNPTYSWSFILALAYQFDKANAVSLTQISAIELTDSDSTNTRQEFQLFDTLAEYAHKFSYELDTERAFALTGGAGLVFPLSKTSQAATMILGTRARVSGGYTTKSVLSGLDTALTFYYLRRFTSSDTLAAESPFPCNRLGDPAQSCSYLGGSSNVRDVLMLGAEGTLKLTSKLALGAQFYFYFARATSLAGTIDGMIDTGPVQITDMSATHWRNTRWLVFTLSYAFTDWFGAGARVSNYFSERNPDNGSLRAPLNPLDTLIGLDLTVSFDQLYMNTRGHVGN
jgi:hypothetical protein